MKLHRLNGLILDDPSLYGEQSGYLCFVKDERNPNYWRGYVGQASKPRVRIQQHFDAYTDKKTHTLFYFILSKDRYFRSLSVAQLWSIPIDASEGDQVAKERHLLYNNLLEMVMCRAFQTLSNLSLREFFGDQELDQYANIGLNVLPPLFQGLKMPPTRKQTYYRGFNNSDDPQVRHWPSERARQRSLIEQSVRNLASMPCRFMAEDYMLAVAQANIEHPLLKSLEPFDGNIDIISLQSSYLLESLFGDTLAAA